MILRDDWEVESTKDWSKCDSMLAFKNASDVEYVVNDEFLVIRRFFNVQVSKEDIEKQRENIFHNRCHIKNKACSMTVNNGSCANVARITLVRKLNLTTTKCHMCAVSRRSFFWTKILGMWVKTIRNYCPLSVKKG
jgi:hypothetical protein